MGHIERRHIRIALLGLVAALLLAGCGEAASTPAATVSTPTPTVPAAANYTINIPRTDIFAPYIVAINAGDTVTWLNGDTIPHTVVTTPTADGGVINPTQFQFVLQPNQHTSIVLRSPGVYYYYCGLHASLNAQGRAAAYPTMRPYPVAMDGLIYVRGPGLSGLSSATVNMTTSDTFTPWITVVNRDAAITWQNQTSQTMQVRSVPSYGLVDPVPLAFTVAPSASTTLHLSRPGIYDYYAVGPAQLEPQWLRPVATKGTPGYPVPMEGVVVVLDS